MTWYCNWPAIVNLNGQKGPGDMKLKMSRSLREMADAAGQFDSRPTGVFQVDFHSPLGYTVVMFQVVIARVR